MLDIEIRVFSIPTASGRLSRESIVQVTSYLDCVANNETLVEQYLELLTSRVDAPSGDLYHNAIGSLLMS